MIISDSPKSTNTPALKLTATRTMTASKTPQPTVESYAMDSKVSPNGEYTAYANFYNGTEQQTIEIKDKQGKLLWQVPYQGELPHGDPRTMIGIYRWSNDSSRLYFCYYWSPDGGELFVKKSCQVLQTINISTGEIQPVFPEEYTAFDISLDETQSAYISCHSEPCIIHIRNNLTGTKKTAYNIFGSRNDFAIGSMEWLPNANGLAFVIQDINHMVRTIYLNPITMKQKIVKENPIYGYYKWAYFQGWAADETLEFIEESGNGTQVIHIDIQDNESIVIGTPTP